MDWLEEKETNALENLTIIDCIDYYWWLWFLGIQISCDGNLLYPSLRNQSLRDKCTMEYLGYLLQFPSLLRLTPKKTGGVHKNGSSWNVVCCIYPETTYFRQCKVSNTRILECAFPLFGIQLSKLGTTRAVACEGPHIQWTKQLAYIMYMIHISKNEYHLRLVTCFELLTSSFDFHAIKLPTKSMIHVTPGSNAIVFRRFRTGCYKLELIYAQETLSRPWQA